MLSHIFIGITDFERALRFYRPVLASLGIEERFCEPERPWAGWHSAGGQRPLFVIARPHDGQPPAPGNGQMTAFLAPSRATVHAAHPAALPHPRRQAVNGPHKAPGTENQAASRPLLHSAGHPG